MIVVLDKVVVINLFWICLAIVRAFRGLKIIYLLKEICGLPGIFEKFAASPPIDDIASG
ncbi:MAG: hypothetical protein ACRERV_05535 [Methylococcales bacterium]